MKKYREDYRGPGEPFPKLKANEKIIGISITPSSPFMVQMVLVIEETVPFRSRIRTK